MTCQLVCVPPDVVSQVWPHIEGLIYVAMKKGDISSFEPVKQSVLDGKSLLWVAWDEEAKNIKAAAVTELQKTEWSKFCIVVAAGGKDLNTWLDIGGPIYEFAKAEGCKAMRFIGRKGWAGVLPGWRVTRYVMERTL